MQLVFSSGWLYLFIIVLLICVVRIFIKVRSIHSGSGGGSDRVIHIGKILNGGMNDAADRALLDRASTLCGEGRHEQAVRILDRALGETAAGGDRRARGMILLHRGICCRGLAGRCKDAELLAEAAQNFREAVDLLSASGSPDEQASAMVRLGDVNSSMYRVTGNRRNIVNAIRSHASALKILAENKTSLEYALTLSRLGTDLILLAELENEAQNLNKAARAYSESLRNLPEEEHTEHRDNISARLEAVRERIDALRRETDD